MGQPERLPDLHAKSNGVGAQETAGSRARDASGGDAFGDKGPLLYLVRETKSTTVASELRGTENQKNHCGKRHFVGALGVDYRVITSADELP